MGGIGKHQTRLPPSSLDRGGNRQTRLSSMFPFPLFLGPLCLPIPGSLRSYYYLYSQTRRLTCWHIKYIWLGAMRIWVDRALLCITNVRHMQEQISSLPYLTRQPVLRPAFRLELKWRKFAFKNESSEEMAYLMHFSCRQGTDVKVIMNLSTWTTLWIKQEVVTAITVATWKQESCKM